MGDRMVMVVFRFRCLGGLVAWKIGQKIGQKIF